MFVCKINYIFSTKQRRISPYWRSRFVIFFGMSNLITVSKLIKRLRLTARCTSPTGMYTKYGCNNDDNGRGINLPGLVQLWARINQFSWEIYRICYCIRGIWKALKPRPRSSTWKLRKSNDLLKVEPAWVSIALVSRNRVEVQPFSDRFFLIK